MLVAQHNYVTFSLPGWKYPKQVLKYSNEPKMIYTDDFCCCIELRCGCILIAILEVLFRGLDRFFVDRK